MSKKKNNYNWMTGPQAQIADSLLSSGLITPDTKIVKSPTNLYSGNFRPSPRPRSKSAGVTRMHSPRESINRRLQHPSTEINTPTVSPRIIKRSPKTQSPKNESPFKRNGVDRTKPKMTPSPAPPSPPAPQIGMPRITEIIESHKKVLPKHDGDDLLEYYRSQIDAVAARKTRNVSERALKRMDQVEITTNVLNRIILDIRTFSEGHSKTLYEAKSFYQSLAEEIPRYKREYEDIIQSKEAEIVELNQQIQELKNQNGGTSEEIIHLRETIEDLKDRVANEKAVHAHLQKTIDMMNYKEDESQEEIKRFKSRVSKAEKERDDLSKIVDEKNQQISQFQIQAQAAEVELRQYADIGMSVRKFKREAEEWKEKYENAQKRIAELTPQKDSKCINTRESYVAFMTRPPKHNHEHRKQKYEDLPPEKQLKIPQTDPRPKMQNIKRVRSNSVEKINTARSTSTIGSARSTNSRSSSAISTPQKSSRHVMESYSISNQPMPTGYEINHNNVLPATQVITKCVYKLIPLPIIKPTPPPSNLFVSLTREIRRQPRSFCWLLTHIVDFFHTSTEYEVGDSIANTLKTRMMKECNMPAVANQIFGDVVDAAQRFQSTSDTIDFFLRFITKEYSTVDFAFVQLLFSLTFECCFPKIQELLSDEDLSPIGGPQFLIHVDLCAKAISSMFPYYNGNVDVDRMRKETSSTPHPDLVSYWSFVQQALECFRATQIQFHKMVRSLLLLAGWMANKELPNETFRNLVLFVRYDASENSIQRLWEKYKLYISMTTDFEFTTTSFIQFCATFTDFASDILKLPYNPTFENSFKMLREPQMKLIVFFRKRYTGFMNEVMKRIPQSLYERCAPTYVKLRNALLKVDISNAATCYRHLIQLIDLKLTEDNPFLVVPSNVEEEDSKPLVTMIRSREKLIASALNDVSSPASSRR